MGKQAKVRYNRSKKCPHMDTWVLQPFMTEMSDLEFIHKSR